MIMDILKKLTFLDALNFEVWTFTLQLFGFFCLLEFVLVLETFSTLLLTDSK